MLCWFVGAMTTPVVDEWKFEMYGTVTVPEHGDANVPRIDLHTTHKEYIGIGPAYKYVGNMEKETCEHEWAEIILQREGRITLPMLRQMCVKCWKVRNACTHARFGTPAWNGNEMTIKQGRCVTCGDPGDVP